MSIVRHIFLVLLVLWATTSPAYAYIDGGSAHLLIQGLIAAAVGALYYLRHPKEIWRSLKKRWKRDRS
ncbi:hypothetical protein [Roseateles violae]|uniref:Uncharacterized protein n=1 Tax=Roseateles violae TaxID=3058042 RepID=A0ABT8DRJ6_9BURK|nr:hypothetical protein [Pelomonas sp. PFR6]MDN3920960.1 hypothetical protein [Pelomonas sp. PFR6]